MKNDLSYAKSRNVDDKNVLNSSDDNLEENVILNTEIIIFNDNSDEKNENMDNTNINVGSKIIDKDNSFNNKNISTIRLENQQSDECSYECYNDIMEDNALQSISEEAKNTNMNCTKNSLIVNYMGDDSLLSIKGEESLSNNTNSNSVSNNNNNNNISSNYNSKSNSNIDSNSNNNSYCNIRCVGNNYDGDNSNNYTDAYSKGTYNYGDINEHSYKGINKTERDNNKKNYNNCSDLSNIQVESNYINNSTNVEKENINDNSNNNGMYYKEIIEENENDNSFFDKREKIDEDILNREDIKLILNQKSLYNSKHRDEKYSNNHKPFGVGERVIEKEDDRIGNENDDVNADVISFSSNNSMEEKVSSPSDCKNDESNENDANDANEPNDENNENGEDVTANILPQSHESGKTNFSNLKNNEINSFSAATNYDNTNITNVHSYEDYHIDIESNSNINHFEESGNILWKCNNLNSNNIILNKNYNVSGIKNVNRKTSIDEKNEFHGCSNVNKEDDVYEEKAELNEVAHLYEENTFMETEKSNGDNTIEGGMNNKSSSNSNRVGMKFKLGNMFRSFFDESKNGNLGDDNDGTSNIHKEVEKYDVSANDNDNDNENCNENDNVNYSDDYQNMHNHTYDDVNFSSTKTSFSDSYKLNKTHIGNSSLSTELVEKIKEDFNNECKIDEDKNINNYMQSNSFHDDNNGNQNSKEKAMTAMDKDINNEFEKLALYNDINKSVLLNLDDSSCINNIELSYNDMPWLNEKGANINNVGHNNKSSDHCFPSEENKSNLKNNEYVTNDDVNNVSLPNVISPDGIDDNNETYLCTEGDDAIEEMINNEGSDKIGSTDNFASSENDANVSNVMEKENLLKKKTDECKREKSYVEMSNCNDYNKRRRSSIISNETRKERKLNMEDITVDECGDDNIKMNYNKYNNDSYNMTTKVNKIKYESYTKIMENINLKSSTNDLSKNEINTSNDPNDNFTLMNGNSESINNLLQNGSNAPFLNCGINGNTHILDNDGNINKNNNNDYRNAYRIGMRDNVDVNEDINNAMYSGMNGNDNDICGNNGSYNINGSNDRSYNIDGSNDRSYNIDGSNDRSYFDDGGNNHAYNNNHMSVIRDNINDNSVYIELSTKNSNANYDEYIDIDNENNNASDDCKNSSDDNSEKKNLNNSDLNDKKKNILDNETLLPMANISRIMKRILPASAKVAKESKDIIRECVTEFIQFLTSEASDRCLRERRKTISGEDILFSMEKLGFSDYIEPLSEYLNKWKQGLNNLSSNHEKKFQNLRNSQDQNCIFNNSINEGNAKNNGINNNGEHMYSKENHDLMNTVYSNPNEIFSSNLNQLYSNSTDNDFINRA
ncbi:oocyst rupture protein 1 [Plasmodium brasilianum]|uniref:Oocyst rupture protein 1 n=1 Tax=Plasmodium brasilianum TaxID=5824 RepID=A0ACB9YBD1_PLABR|nr:oocyst rupture protein 1 [Plasmodium brasilianum]